MIAAETRPMDQVTPCKSYRSEDELAMREAVDLWGRTRWPNARCVHELVMDRGSVRADMAFIAPNHIVAIEIKSRWDTSERLMNQVAMFRLASPELWIVIDEKHVRDTALVRYLFPSVGLAVAHREKVYGGPFRIEVRHEAEPFAPHPEAMLSLLWVAELWAEAQRARLAQGGKPGSHASLVRAMQRLAPEEQLAAVCRQLRARNALWRADPPVAPNGEGRADVCPACGEDIQDGDGTEQGGEVFHFWCVGNDEDASNADR